MLPKAIVLLIKTQCCPTTATVVSNKRSMNLWHAAGADPGFQG